MLNSIFSLLILNPVFEYFKWVYLFLTTIYKNRKKNLRLRYNSKAKNVVFGNYNLINRNVFVENSKLGDYTYISENSVILETEFGKFCSIGPNVRTAPGKHPTHTIVSTHPSIYSNPDYLLNNFSDIDYHNPYRKVFIGNDVWVGANVVVADGVKIGNGVIVAANSLVIKDVPDFAIVRGVPAEIVRFRFEKNEIDFLNSYKWWDKDENWIRGNLSKMLDIKKFVSE